MTGGHALSDGCAAPLLGIAAGYWHSLLFNWAGRYFLRGFHGLRRVPRLLQEDFDSFWTRSHLTSSLTPPIVLLQWRRNNHHIVAVVYAYILFAAMPSSVGSSIDELVARKSVQSYGHCRYVACSWSL
jgi:hypothetical protein